MANKTFKLNTGQEIPAIGLGKLGGGRIICRLVTAQVKYRC